MSLMFLEEAPKWSPNVFSIASARSGSIFPNGHTWGSLLLSPGLISSEKSDLLSSSGLLPPDRLYGGASSGLLIPKIIDFLGATKFLEGLLRSCDQCP